MDKTGKLDLKQELIKLGQWRNEEAGNRFEKALNDEKFPCELLSTLWCQCVQLSIMKTTPLMQRVSLNEFASVVDSDKRDLSLFQFGVLSNSIEAVSVSDLGHTPEQYHAFVTEAVCHIDLYKKTVSEIRKKIEADVDAEFNLKAAQVKGDMLQAVKAEA